MLIYNANPTKSFPINLWFKAWVADLTSPKPIVSPISVPITILTVESGLAVNKDESLLLHSSFKTEVLKTQKWQRNWVFVFNNWWNFFSYIPTKHYLLGKVFQQWIHSCSYVSCNDFRFSKNNTKYLQIPKRSECSVSTRQYSVGSNAFNLNKASLLFLTTLNFVPTSCTLSPGWELLNFFKRARVVLGYSWLIGRRGL